MSSAGPFPSLPFVPQSPLPSLTATSREVPGDSPQATRELQSTGAHSPQISVGPQAGLRGPVHCPGVSATLQPPYPRQPGFLSLVWKPHLCVLRIITGATSSKKPLLIPPVGCDLTVL